MVRQIQSQPFVPIPLSMEELVGGGFGGVGHSGSFSWAGGSSIVYPYHAKWSTFVDGSLMRDALGYPTFSNHAISRQLPMVHPVQSTFFCNGLSGIDPKKWLSKNTASVKGPFSDYDRLKINLSFSVPPFAMIDDATMMDNYSIGGTSTQLCTVFAGSNTVANVPNAAALCLWQTVTARGFRPVHSSKALTLLRKFQRRRITPWHSALRT